MDSNVRIIYGRKDFRQIFQVIFLHSEENCLEDREWLFLKLLVECATFLPSGHQPAWRWVLAKPDLCPAQRPSTAVPRALDERGDWPAASWRLPRKPPGLALWAAQSSVFPQFPNENTLQQWKKWSRRCVSPGAEQRVLVAPVPFPSLGGTSPGVLFPAQGCCPRGAVPSPGMLSPAQGCCQEHRRSEVSCQETLLSATCHFIGDVLSKNLSVLRNWRGSTQDDSRAWGGRSKVTMSLFCHQQPKCVCTTWFNLHLKKFDCLFPASLAVHVSEKLTIFYFSALYVHAHWCQTCFPT